MSNQAMKPPTMVNGKKSDQHESLERRMQLAIAGLLNFGAFYASMLAWMQIIADKRVPSACTDGYAFVKYNPEFFRKFNSWDIRTVLAHEALHKVYMHPIRRGDRDPFLWNVAVDFTVNKVLHDERYSFDAWRHASLRDYCAFLAGNPPPWMVDPKNGGEFIALDPGLGDRTSDAIYEQLLAAKKSNPSGGQQGKTSPGDQEEQNGQGGASSPGEQASGGDESGMPQAALGGDIDYEGAKAAASDKTPEQMEREITASVVSAAQAAKSQGKLPLGIERLMEEYLKSKVNWRAYLRRFMYSAWGPATISGDYSYRRPSRRPGPPGIIQPAFLKHPAAPIVVGVDCSGSIGAKELALFGGAIKSIIKDVRPSRTFVVYYDAEVHSYQEFGPDDVVFLKPEGGGGTDFRPVFDWIEEKKIKPAALVMLTDLMGSFPEKSKIPTLWATTHPGKAPFGQTIELED